jgi:adenylate cyclase class IV
MEAAVREIEVKYQVEDMEALLVALKSRGIELSEPAFQDDQAYAPSWWEFGDSKLGVSFLRLRTVNGRHYFTLKQLKRAWSTRHGLLTVMPCIMRPSAWATDRLSGL